MRFFDPPKPSEPLAPEKIDKTYKSMRFKVFLGAFLGYAGYYLVRKNLSLAAPDMINEGILDTTKVGLAMSGVSIA
ncbi:MAG: glycerol-3-phosphate transporter, partial [Bacteroidales bacterium]|nr:glycerol-3-phosphate transporter [Bacteroidales bacterium]